MTFSAATKHCKSMGAFLAESRSDEENDIIYNFMKHSIWLGATDSANEGTWVWQSDGEGVCYDKWDPIESNQEDKDCPYMYSFNGLWRYAPCDSTIFFVCQKKLEGNVLFF